MKIIAAVDDRFGMFFNHRRLSRDRAVTEKVKEIVGDGKLWIHPYSLDLFPDACAAEDFLDRAGEDDFCFVENRSLQTYSDQITEIYLFFWNRKYPSDLKFDLPLEPFWCEKYTDFPGYSHDNITLEAQETVWANSDSFNSPYVGMKPGCLMTLRRTARSAPRTRG